MTNDFNLADFRHEPKVFARLLSQEFLGIDVRHIERRQFVCLLTGRRFLEDQSFVLIHVL